MFSVEIMIKIDCANCGFHIKRRFLDYLSSRTTRCPSCNVKMIHLARGQTPGQGHVEMDEIRRIIERLEGDWGCLVNEYLTHESKNWGSEEPGLA
ncbi:MAG: hypothetical protein AB7S38_08690 [Vulcanimicrobiota bacterium]|nr:hypothetical protein [Candidatus Eremiobacteraeota bacterium]